MDCASASNPICSPLMAKCIVHDVGTANVTIAARCGCLYPSPPFLEGIVATRDACVGRLKSVVSVINFRKDL